MEACSGRQGFGSPGGQNCPSDPNGNMAKANWNRCSCDRERQVKLRGTLISVHPGAKRWTADSQTAESGENRVLKRWCARVASGHAFLCRPDGAGAAGQCAENWSPGWSHQ